MIPWFESHLVQLGPVGIRTWGTLVAFGFLAGTTIAARRAKAKGLDPKMLWDIAFWTFISAMVGSRIFHVLFYDFGWYLEHPGDAIDPTKPGFSIAGGILFGVLAVWVFTKIKKLDLAAYADAVAWGLPWGVGIGRIGCFLIHDHPGSITSFPLGVRYPDGIVRHDLGLELSLVGFVMGIIFLIADRMRLVRSPGGWVGLFLVLDGISRLGLDMFRVTDARLGPLTPTQWLSLPLMGLGAFLVFRRQVDMGRK
ncbi:prolipoprotein diacylglyceryl transferase [Patescibacteria group bacterium]|nr:prolipoprotein diacylglyceryl transferase [Patescibacteria group bacterium]MBU1448881.1 prolipoprotein diacylglyceryl transferase [Patescibacteria group bacterium]MBU2612935.1 prolipoprotein diacylglyceryl transferase [Patescibacteria group bacterium]